MNYMFRIFLSLKKFAFVTLPEIKLKQRALSCLYHLFLQTDHLNVIQLNRYAL